MAMSITCVWCGYQTGEPQAMGDHQWYEHIHTGSEGAYDLPGTASVPPTEAKVPRPLAHTQTYEVEAVTQQQALRRLADFMDSLEAQENSITLIGLDWQETKGGVLCYATLDNVR